MEKDEGHWLMRLDEIKDKRHYSNSEGRGK
jgi:hypothetical protein